MCQLSGKPTGFQIARSKCEAFDRYKERKAGNCNCNREKAGIRRSKRTKLGNQIKEVGNLSLEAEKKESFQTLSKVNVLRSKTRVVEDEELSKVQK